MKPVRFAPDVEGEIEAAGDHYERERAGLGGEFLECVEEALARLVEYPGSHGFAPGTTPQENIRQVVVARFPYRIVFRERAADLLVVACVHARRAPGYWRSRRER